MRLNKFVASATGMSRRAADTVISEQRININGQLAKIGQVVSVSDQVTLDGRPIAGPESTLTIMLNKPIGYICSREGQGSKTIYDLLPPELYNLKPVGRLDKNSSGLLLLTNDGKLAHELTHPSFCKTKIYEVELNKPLPDSDRIKVEQGVILEDGLSKLKIELPTKNYQLLTIHMQEGRNRQIRRTFDALGYNVVKLHRTQFGPYQLPPKLKPGSFKGLEQI